MYCTGCGRQVGDGARFCPWCGAGLAQPGGGTGAEPEPTSEPAPEPGPGPAPASVPDAEPEPAPARRVPVAGVVAALALVLVVVVGVAAVALLGGDGSGTAADADGEVAATDDTAAEASYTVAYYGVDDAVRVGSSTVIVLYDDEDEPLEDYDLLLMAEDGTALTRHVEGGSFTPEGAEIPAGEYAVVVRDAASNEVHTVPALEVVDETGETDADDADSTGDDADSVDGETDDDSGTDDALPETIVIKVPDEDADADAGDADETGDGSDGSDATDGSDGTLTDQQLAYLLFYLKIAEYEELWGEGAITTNDELGAYNESFYGGVCLIYLIDFEGDGVEELVIVYLESDSDTWPYLSYVVEVWRYDAEAGTIECVCSSPLTDIQEVPMLFLIEGVGTGSGYLLRWYAASPDNRVTFVYTADDGSLSVALYDYDGLTIDGVEVDDETCAAFLDDYLHLSSDDETIWWFEFQTGELEDEENLLLISEEVRARILEGAMSIFNRSSEDEDASESDLVRYEEVLDFIYDGLTTSWEGYEDLYYEEGSGYEMISYLWYWYNTYEEPSSAGYAFVDLDGDGLNELVVGGVSDDGTYTLLDLYTIVDGEVVNIASAGESWFYWICPDLTIAYVEGGAFTSTYVYYQLVDGALAFVEMVIYDAYEDADYPWLYGTISGSLTSTTESEARAIIDSHADSLELDMTSFDEYER